ncbi:MAG: cell division protein ZapA [Saprospiraceae bacterium]|nr:cell division protein ZapA [Saprospiraceae bacterium]
METQELVSTSVSIAGRSYSIKVNPSDERVIKQIVKEVNEKLNSFSTSYTKKDKVDCMAMVLLSYAVDLHKNKDNEGAAMEPEVLDQIHKIDSLLDELLKPAVV